VFENPIASDETECDVAAVSELPRPRAFERDGFVVLSEHLSPAALRPGLAELPKVFPTRDEFHDDIDPDRNARFRSEFGGISNFPFRSTELSLLAVHDDLIELAEELLGSQGLRVYSIEGWAKYTGAADYEQELHRDYLNHSLLVPSPGDDPTQVEMFLYLSEVDPPHGPPSYVPLTDTRSLPALPNWLPRVGCATNDERPAWVSPHGWPDLYGREVSAVGKAGTVVAYRVETFHRATSMTAPRGARYTIHVNFRRSDCDWITRRAWTDTANTPEWSSFVARASVRQLQLFGFPPPGNPYWNTETLTDATRRYPGFDPDPWRIPPPLPDRA
jgi:hypothetical protein